MGDGTCAAISTYVPMEVDVVKTLYKAGEGEEGGEINKFANILLLQRTERLNIPW